MEFKKLDVSEDAETGTADEDYVGENLEDRFEIWHRGQLVFMVDIHEEEFVVEWYTRKSVRGFAREAKELLTHDREMRVSCMLSEEDEDRYLQNKTIPVINARGSYPEECSYLEVDPNGESAAVAWAEGDPHPTITMRGSTDSIELLGQFAEATIVDTELSTEEIEDVIMRAIDEIRDLIDSSGDGGGLTDIVNRI